MTDLQLKLMDRADKTKSFWCLINTKFDWVCTICDDKNYLWMKLYGWMWVIWILPNIDNQITDIIWHPITYWRLCFLSETSPKETNIISAYIRMSLKFREYPDMIQKTCIEWNDEINNLVLDFLLTLPK